MDYLEDVLDDILQEEFNTIADDGSIPQVCNLFVNLYQQCIHGNYAGVESLRQQYLVMQQNSKKSIKLPTDPTDLDESEDDSEEEEEGNHSNSHPQPSNDNDVPMLIDNSNNNNNHDQMEEDNNNEEEEDDGWTTVKKKTKKPNTKSKGFFISFHFPYFSSSNLRCR